MRLSKFAAFLRAQGSRERHAVGLSVRTLPLSAETYDRRLKDKAAAAAAYAQVPQSSSNYKAAQKKLR